MPAILVSPYIEAGTVFRSGTAMPYDHTSILATLRDWLNIPQEKMLTSSRVKDAPTFANILTRSAPRTDLPGITLNVAATKPKTQFWAHNDLQSAILSAHGRRYRHGFRNWSRMKAFGTPPSASQSQ